MHAFLIMGNFFILEKIPKIFLNEIQIMFTIETYCRALFHRHIFFSEVCSTIKTVFPSLYGQRTFFLFDIWTNYAKVLPFPSVCNTFFKLLWETCKLIILHRLSLYFDKKVIASSFGVSKQSENYKMYLNVKFHLF